MVRGFQYRFYPTHEQTQMLARTFGCVRYVYNWALRVRTDAWFKKQQRVGYAKTSAMLTQLKHTPECEWLNEVSSVACQQSLRHLQDAFVNFWEKRAAYPGFKKRRNRQSAEFTKAAFTWDGQTCSISKLGNLKIRWSRRFSGQPTTVHVSRTPSGRYYVSFRVDEPVPAMPKAQGTIGIDLGLKSFIAISTGEIIDSPRPMRRKMAQLKRAQKALSRKQRGSKNRAKARLRLAKVHAHIGDIRKDFLHKLSTRLIRENQTIAVENLNVLGMMANHRLAGAIGDSGWGEFVRQLGYKSEWYGRTFVKIDRFYPSSKRCNDCGFVMKELPLDIRQWICPECGVDHDRDVNAARNILAAGLAVIACGDGVRPPRSKDRIGNRPRNRNRPEAYA